MACKGCGKRRANVQKSVKTIMNNNQFEGDENFKSVIYRGGDYTHPVGSPTKILHTYGIYTYSTRSKHGDQLWIHVDDIAARPDLFEVVEEVIVQNNVQTESVSNQEVVDEPDTNEDVLDTVSTDVVSSNSIVTAVLVTDYVKLDSNEYSHYLPAIKDLKSGKLEGFKDKVTDKWMVTLN